MLIVGISVNNHHANKLEVTGSNKTVKETVVGESWVNAQLKQVCPIICETIAINNK